MDWNHILFAAGESLLGVAALGATAILFALLSSPGRILRAASPSLVAVGIAAISCLLAGLPGIEDQRWAEYFPLTGFAVAVALIVPSILALRYKWAGILHVVTLAAILFLWFVTSLAIAHDGP